MAQNMSVSITLRLIDQYTSGVRAFQQQLQQLQRGFQQLNSSVGGSSSTPPFGRLQQQVRALNTDVRALAGSLGHVNRAMAPSGGGSFVQQQISGMRQLLNMQAQAIANQNRLASGGGGRGPGGPGSSSFWGRRGFNPNASLADRAQYRGVIFLEQSLGEAIIEPDVARTRLRRLDLAPETMAMAEQAAAQYTRLMPELTRGAVLNSVAEIVTQFRTDAEAFQALPYLLRVQQLDIQAGRSAKDSRQGMLDLLKAVGMTGRLTDADGAFTEQEAANVLDAYLRAREIGGADINPQGFRQLIKYMKASAQTLSTSAILEAAILAPDVGFSTFGNQAQMLIRSFAGARATKTALEAQARWGLRSAEIDPRHPEGPGRLRAGPLVDSELLRESPNEWWRKHILGPDGVLRRMGLDPARSSPAAIADALAPLNSNMSAENIALIFTHMQGELRNQLERAWRLNRGLPMWEYGAMDEAAQGSFLTGLMRTRARIIDTLNSIGDNFTDIVLPPLNRFADLLQNISDLTNPRTGNPAAAMGMLAGGAAGAFLLARGVLRRMGPSSRTLLGGGAGLLLGGGAEGALMGALLGRGVGAGAAGTGAAAAAAGAAGAAGAAAGRAWVGRFASTIWRAGRSMTLWGLAGSLTAEIVTNWETIKTRLVAIFDEIKQAAPSWLGGGDKGWAGFSNPEGIAKLPEDLQNYRKSWREWMLSMPGGEWLQRNTWGLAMPAFEDARLKALAASPHGGLDLADLAAVPKTANNTVNTGPINVTVNVGGSNASPQTIGEAAGNAVGSQIRGLLGDTPADLSHGAP